MNPAFVVAAILTALELGMGFFALFSRGGSLVTLILSAVRPDRDFPRNNYLI
jgi:hypothetical protein